jgi:hypothetical protein
MVWRKLPARIVDVTSCHSLGRYVSLVVVKAGLNVCRLAKLSSERSISHMDQHHPILGFKFVKSVTDLV